MLDTHLSTKTFSNEQCIVGATNAKQQGINNLLNLGGQMLLAGGGFGA